MPQATAGEPSGVSHLLRRFFPIFCALVALVTLGYALYDPFQIDGDAINYMDISDYIRSHQWPAVVNGYWHPLYPALLALFHGVFHSQLANELHAYYIANFAIFLLEMVAMVAFTDSIVSVREAMQQPAAARARFALERYSLRYLGLTLLVIASQRELSLGKVRPDALLQALLLFAIASLLRYLASGSLLFACTMGVALGCAYLTKSFAFLFAFLSIGVLVLFSTFWCKRKIVTALVSGALAFACFAALAFPYVAALSKQRGRFDFGDSGALNLAWYVGGTEKMHIQPYMADRFGSAEVHLKHPDKELLRSPQILSYAALPYGTMPDWFDPSYFNDQVKPHLNLKGEISRGARNSVLVVRYLFNHPEGWLLLVILLALGGRTALGVRGAEGFWIPSAALGATAWGIYATVNTEERYVTFAYLCILIPVFATLRAPARETKPWFRPVAECMVLLMAVLASSESLRTIFEDRRQLSLIPLPGGWYSPRDEHAAEALKSMNLQPGDTVACVGYSACLGDFYWARLAGLRVLTEIYAPDGIPAYEFLTTLPNRDLAIDVVRRQGAKVLVADFSGAPALPTPPELANWQQLGDSTLYELPLNVPEGTMPTRPPATPRRKPSI
jgi:4-amino-4-deoxy-L-arabinose transferase-like glycosyltransferase